MSNFNYYLNRQGTRGRQGAKGEKGDTGYSPYIDIKSNTPTEFIMTIHNESESFDTPNLIPTAIGEKVTEMDAVLTTYTEDIANLKLDITAIENKNTAQDSDIAALRTRVGGTEESIEDLNHKYTVLGSEVSDLSVKKQNRLVEGANITLTNNDDGTTTISASGGGGGGGSSPLDSYIEGSTTENITTISAKNGKDLELSAPTIAVGDNLVNEINGANTQLYLKQGDIAEGDNITVEKTATGVKISSTGGASGDVPIATTQTAGKVKPDGTTITITEDGTISSVGGGSSEPPANMVTTDTTQTITGQKSFTDNYLYLGENNNLSIIQTLNRTGSSQVSIGATEGDIILAAGSVVSEDDDGGIQTRNGLVKDANGNIFVTTNNITSSDGSITISRNARGVVNLSASTSGGSTPANMVTTDTDQDITGIKTFKGNVNNNDPSIIFGSRRIGLDDVIGGKIKVNGRDNFEISTGAKGDSELALRMTKNASNSPSYFEFTSNTSDIIPAIKLGITNYQGTIKYDTSAYPNSFLFETQNSLSGYPYSSFKIGDDTLTFKKTDGTVVDLLAGGANITEDEYYYKAGDVFTTESSVVLPAIFSANKTQILMSIPMPKSMKNVSNISITKCVLSVRVPDGGYLPSAHFDFSAEAGTTITTIKAFDNLLSIIIDKTAGWETQVANNVPLAVQISPAELIVEFN